MASSPKRTLHRRLAVLTQAARDKIRRREDLRDRASAWGSIRAALAAANIDPARILALRGLCSVESELALLGDSPELRRADGAFIAQDPALAARASYAAQVADRVPRFARRPPPDPGASLFDWYAWSLARRPRAQGRTVAMR
jgi:hypothetical protein